MTSAPSLLVEASSPSRVARFLAIGCALALFYGTSNSAHAQWGFGGYGYGWGMMGGGGVSNYMNQANINARSNSAANYAYSIRQNIPGTGSVYANNPNSYINRLRDTSYFQRFDVSTRRTLGQSSTRSTSTGTASPNIAAASTPAIPPLAQFFSTAGMLVWPSQAPTEGDLAGKRSTADQATLAVNEQLKSNGFAPVGQITDARTKLVAYGQPALDYLRANTSQTVFESFHRFLLSLYDALGAAGTARPPSAGR